MIIIIIKMITIMMAKMMTKCTVVLPCAIVMVANGLWNALSSSHRVPSPPPSPPLPAHLGNMISRLSWTSKKFKDISDPLFGTHMCLAKEI